MKTNLKNFTNDADDAVLIHQHDELCAKKT